MIGLTLSYAKEDKEDSKGINKFALLNSIIGIPTLIFLIFLIVKGFLAEFLVIGYCSIAVLVVGIGYSIFKLIKK